VTPGTTRWELDPPVSAAPGRVGAAGAGERAVHRAGPRDVAALVEVLRRAFDDDPVPQFAFRSERARRRGLRAFFAAQLRHSYLRTGQVWTTADAAGAALWAPPGKVQPPWRALLHLLPVAPYLNAAHAPELARLLAAVDQQRPPEPHWYLATLGTDPARQGRGVGSALVRAVLARVDEQGLPAYLESSKQSNIAFYARHGFEVTGEITVAGAPTLWLMWRTPRPPGG